MLAFLSDTAFSYSGNWRAMLGVLALPAVILIILVVFLPNSPRWLAEKGRHIEAEEVLRMLRDTSEKARDELNEIRESLKLKQGGWALFKVNRNVRRAVFLGMLLQAMQQFTGMNIIMYYAPRIFKMAGFTTTEQQMIATLVVGLTFMFATFIAVFTVDKAGRKPALKIGFSVMALGTLVLGYCLMQFDNGTASSGLSLALRRHDHDVYCRVCDERGAGGVDPLLRDPAAKMPRLRYHLLDHHQLGVEHDHRRHFPDAA
ncbi:Arabinose-proton symporter [Klebsiella pneumoniae subsp. rhinoscleromatis]|nr:Arabinose-proton symporter [Klebsiella pneumoniae subsp. rhinoscleromatis]